MPNPAPGTHIAALNSIYGQGVTYRAYADGRLKRPMIHRWHYTKIRGAVPLWHAQCIEIYDTTPLLRQMMRAVDAKYR